MLSELSSAQTVPIFDIMLAYDCERTNQVYLLILRNVLYIKSMENNLITPFILQEASLIVKKRAKIHCDLDAVTAEDRTIQECDTGLFITMQLGVYSFIFR